MFGRAEAGIACGNDTVGAASAGNVKVSVALHATSAPETMRTENDAGDVVIVIGNGNDAPCGSSEEVASTGLEHPAPVWRVKDPDAGNRASIIDGTMEPGISGAKAIVGGLTRAPAALERCSS